MAQRQMVEALIKHGADPNIAGNDGQSPMSMAQKMGHTEMIALLSGQAGDSAPTAVASTSLAEQVQARIQAMSIVGQINKTNGEKSFQQLRQLGPAGAMALLDGMKDQNLETKQICLYGLSHWGSPLPLEAQEPLRAFLDDPKTDELWRFEVLKALSNTARNDEEKTQILVSKLTDHDNDLVWRTIGLLAEMGPNAKSALPVLRKMNSTTTDHNLHLTLNGAIDKIENPS